jgi:hypothetical protein
MTASNIVYRALRLIGVLESGETPDANIASDALYVLNRIIESLNNEGLIAYNTVNDTFSLVASTSLYTIGSGGTYDTTRPQEIISAFIRNDSNYDYPLTIIGRKEYDNLHYKASESDVPSKLYYNPTYPLGYIYLWPSPAGAYTIGITQRVQLTEFSSLADTVTLPDGFENMFVYLLAVEFSPEGAGRDASQTVIAKARECKENIKRINNQNNRSRANLSDLNMLSGSSYGSYDINSDTYL